MKNNYKILGVSEKATDSEIRVAYTELKAKYREEMFSDGEKGNAAAKKLTELEAAYEEIMSSRSEKAAKNDDGLFKQVDAAIKADDLKRAQELLDSFNERNAEWHYLQAVVYYRKGWTNESKKQLEIARRMQPDTEKYEKAYEKMNAKINGNASAQNAGANVGEGASGNGAGNYDEPQMGGEGCMDFCCRLAICNVLLNCCCNCR